MKFLVVDDDIDLARYIAAVLEAEGVACDVSETAETAYKLFIRNQYDAMIVDAILPGSSGISLVRELKEINPEIPVLFCTGSSDEFNKKLMWSQGMVCHKPLGESFTMIVRQFMQTVHEKRS